MRSHVSTPSLCWIPVGFSMKHKGLSLVINIISMILDKRGNFYGTSVKDLIFRKHGIWALYLPSYFDEIKLWSSLWRKFMLPCWNLVEDKILNFIWLLLEITMSRKPLNWIRIFEIQSSNKGKLNTYLLYKDLRLYHFSGSPLEMLSVPRALCVKSWLKTTLKMGKISIFTRLEGSEGVNP